MSWRTHKNRFITHDFKHVTHTFENIIKCLESHAQWFLINNEISAYNSMIDTITILNTENWKKSDYSTVNKKLNWTGVGYDYKRPLYEFVIDVLIEHMEWFEENNFIHESCEMALAKGYLYKLEGIYYGGCSWMEEYAEKQIQNK